VEYNGKDLYLGLTDSETNWVAKGTAPINDGSVTITLKTPGPDGSISETDWTGSGDFYVQYQICEGDTVLIFGNFDGALTVSAPLTSLNFAEKAIVPYPYPDRKNTLSLEVSVTVNGENDIPDDYHVDIALFLDGDCKQEILGTNIYSHTGSIVTSPPLTITYDIPAYKTSRQIYFAVDLSKGGRTVQITPVSGKSLELAAGDTTYLEIDLGEINITYDFE
jgi:hypothetical protein